MNLSITICLHRIIYLLTWRSSLFLGYSCFLSFANLRFFTFLLFSWNPTLSVQFWLKLTINKVFLILPSKNQKNKQLQVLQVCHWCGFRNELSEKEYPTKLEPIHIYVFIFFYSTFIVNIALIFLVMTEFMLQFYFPSLVSTKAFTVF